MNNAFWCLFWFCAWLTTGGQAIRCYKCNGCENVSAQKETCRNVDVQHEQVGCLTQRVSVSGSAMIIKKCVIYEKFHKYNCSALPDSAPLTCDVCLDDLCNAAPSTVFNNPYLLTIPLLILAYKLIA